MALYKTLTLTNNFNTKTVLENVYIKVTRIEGSKLELTAEVSLLPKEGGEPYKVQRVTFVPDLNGSNFIAQAYLHLKSLPEFADAVDC
jgi:hypothetical protein